MEFRDYDELRFLWWEGGELLVELVEYWMVKYIFGVMLLLSVVNFCLKKIVDDGLKGLKLDVLIKNNWWLIGFKFLWKGGDYWLKMIEVFCFKDEDLEVRKEN